MIVDLVKDIIVLLILLDLFSCVMLYCVCVTPASLEGGRGEWRRGSRGLANVVLLSHSGLDRGR